MSHMEALGGGQRVCRKGEETSPSIWNIFKGNTPPDQCRLNGGHQKVLHSVDKKIENYVDPEKKCQHNYKEDV